MSSPSLLTCLNQQIPYNWTKEVFFKAVSSLPALFMWDLPIFSQKTSCKLSIPLKLDLEFWFDLGLSYLLSFDFHAEWFKVNLYIFCLFHSGDREGMYSFAPLKNICLCFPTISVMSPFLWRKSKTCDPYVLVLSYSPIVKCFWRGKYLLLAFHLLVMWISCLD